MIRRNQHWDAAFRSFRTGFGGCLGLEGCVCISQAQSNSQICTSCLIKVSDDVYRVDVDAWLEITAAAQHGVAL